MIDKLKSTILIETLESKTAGYPKFDYKKVFVIEDQKNISALDASKLVGDRKYTPTAKDKIYLTPGCNIPRFKLKTFCENNNVALVKYQDKANAVFIGPESYTELCELDYWGYHKIDKMTALNYFSRILGSDARYDAFIKDIESSECSNIYMHYSPMTAIQNKEFFNVTLYTGSVPGRSSIPLVVDTLNKYNTLKGLSTNPNIYSQDDILKLLNTGTIMNEEMYHSIKRLFESTDTQNTILAMESIANCDYERSAVYLLLLIKEFGQKIESSPTKNHVNFRSFLKFFGIDNVSNVDLDDIINSLRAKKLLSPMNLKKLMPLAMDQMTKDSRLESFKVTDIAVSDEIMTALSENVLDNSNLDIVYDSGEEINPHID